MKYAILIMYKCKESENMGKTKRKLRKGIFIKLIIAIVLLAGGLYFYHDLTTKKQLTPKYLASSGEKIILYDEEGKNVKELVRGTKINLYINQQGEERSKIKYEDVDYFVMNKNIVDDYKDTVQEKEVYVRTSYNLKKASDSLELMDLVKKEDKLEIIGFDTLNSDGTVNMYQVKYQDNEGYFYAKYTVSDLEKAKENYDYNGAYEFHKKQKNTYGGGDGASLDYFPVVKPKFENNVMPKNVYSLYLNGTKATMAMVDDYIEFAKTTKINAFVIDIVDDVNIGYASPYMKEKSPTSYKNAQNSVEDYQKAVQKLKDNGFYVIGRITAFKDTYYVNDHKENAITNSSGNPLKHQSSYWPSAFNRDVWQYDVELAMEAVNLMGFNEIQFDYVRFPDGLGTMEKNKTVNYHNTYNETKAQAIQRFLMYATNELHKLNVYVSADVFGESSYGSGYITSYGQYWPAISTVVDVISAMPYTDHFGKNYGGHAEPWIYPYDTISFWAKTAKKEQDMTANPAVARTWITAYNTPVAASGTKLAYNGKEVSAQIKALYDNGLDGGYMTWNAYSYLNNLKKYKNQKDAYMKEY